MASKLDELAEEIVTLAPSEQECLLEKVAELNYRRGLDELARKYRSRLAAEGKSDGTVDEIMAELKRSREEIAAHEYRP